MSIKILLTGCAGFIGSNIAERLLWEWYQVIGLDNLENGYYKNISDFVGLPNFQFIRGDIRDFVFIDTLIREHAITHICHQAARWSVPKSIEDPILSNEINVTGTLNLLWSAHTNKVKRFVCAISSSVYGDTPTLPKVETMEYNPISPYALTKVTKELYCKLFYHLYGLETIGLRYFNVYGKKQDPDGPYAALIPRWIQKAQENQDLPLNGTGSQTRDFTYIDDVVQANILSLFTENQEAFGKGFNISYGERTSIRELGTIILEKTHSSGMIAPSEVRKWDIEHSLWDIGLARRLLSYAPKTDMTSGIEKTLSWYHENPSYFHNLSHV
jgi:UDP-N-acetylglucosamine/UDP-N-acetylgalactosamine 4-epimerase